MPTYATRDDLTASKYVPATMTIPDDPEASRLLAAASEHVDGLLITAIYDIDDGTGLPTETPVVNALRDAACAQAAWWLSTGDEDGAAAQYQSVGIGSVTLTRAGAGSSGGGADRVSAVTSDSAVQVLQQAGLLGQGPIPL